MSLNARKSMSPARAKPKRRLYPTSRRRWGFISSYREVKRRLEAAGCIAATHKGSHVKSVRRNEFAVDTAIMPKKPEIPVGTLRSILSQAHFGLDEWETL